MTIEIDLSPQGIANAVKRLQDMKENLKYGLQQTIDMLAKEGAMIAQSGNGSMANVADMSVSETQSKIIMSGGDEMLIAEFGAGDATLSPGDYFENGGSLDSDVFPGAYSILHAQEYYNWGSWKFGGEYYTEVEAKHGLFNAKVWIESEAVRMAKEVIKL